MQHNLKKYHVTPFGLWFLLGFCSPKPTLYLFFVQKVLEQSHY